MPGWSVLPSSRWPEWCNANLQQNKLNDLTHFFWVLGFFKVIHLVWEPKLSQAKRKEKLETSSRIFSSQKLRSWTFNKSPLTWNASVSVTSISPSLSFEVFGMQVQHQTSTHAGNILSSYGNPCKLNPCPIVCYVLVLTKSKAKENGHCQTKCCQGFGQLFGKGRMFGRPFFKTNPEELSTLCIYPENSWTPQRTCQSKKTLSITTHAQYIYPATLEEHPINNYDPDRVLLGNHAMERICINSYTGLGEASSRTHSRTKSWNVAQEGTTVDMYCPSAAA